MNCIFLAAAAAIAAELVNVPELMKMESGETVASVEQWEKVRRHEIRRFFETDVYGRRPVERPPHRQPPAAASTSC